MCLGVCLRGRTFPTVQTVDVSLYFHTTSIGEDTCDRLLILAVEPIVRQSSRELSLKAASPSSMPPRPGPTRKV